MKNIVILLSIFIINIGCDENRVFEKNVDFEQHTWSYENKVKFETILDNSRHKNLYINFRHGHYFETRNLRLKLHITPPSGEQSTTNINLLLSEPNGKWFSNCSGNICNIQYLLPKFSQYLFQEEGLYHFEIEQDMRSDLLSHAMAVGLRIENTTE